MGQYEYLTRDPWAVLSGQPKAAHDNTVYFTRVMARPNGLPDGDYDFQYAGASSARYAALKSGAVDSALLTPPFDSLAEREGVAESGWRLVTNVGRDSGYTVPHLHFHLLGGRKMSWPPG